MMMIISTIFNPPTFLNYEPNNYFYYLDHYPSFTRGLEKVLFYYYIVYMSNLNKLLEHSLSDKEIKDFFDDKINVLRYSDLSNYKNLDDILGKYRRAIILFENENNLNHWCLVHEVDIKGQKPYVEWFDSYGIIPDNEFDYIPKSFQNLSKQKRGTLIKLLINQPLQVHYSQYRLQELHKGINTCGVWCCVRALYNMISEDEFAKLFRSGEQFGLTPDELVSLLFYKELGALNLI